MNIVLLGGPCAGKGTLAKQLKELNYFLVAPGELYRAEANAKTEFGLKAKEYWGSGNICPDDMTNELIRKTIESIHSKKVFDGYPRSLNQAKYLDSICKVNLILDLYVDEETAIERLQKRKTKENRQDDTEEILKQRFKVYKDNNQDIVNYYLNFNYRLIKTSDKTPEQTYAFVCDILSELGDI